MMRQRVTGLTMTSMLLLAASISTGQDLDFSKPPEQLQAVLNRKIWLEIQSDAAKVRRNAAMAAGVERRKASQAIGVRGVTRVNGKSVRLKMMVLLVPPDPPEAEIIDPDEDIVDVEPEADRAALNIIDSYVMAESNFNDWIFGRKIWPERRRWHLVNLLDDRIKQAVESDGWAESQAAKLRLAGSGDIKRFFDAVDVERTTFHAVKRKYGPGVAALERLKPLSDQFEAGPFDEGSLFAKTLEKLRSSGRKQP